MKGLSLKDQTVFITGASSGIGKACAGLFASLGVNVVISARRLDRLKTMEKEISLQHKVKVIPVQLDVQNNTKVEALFRQLEKDKIEIDILVNNAGLALSTDKMQDAKVSNWDIMIDTNIKGLLYVTRAVLPGMVKRNRGHIINIGSIAGHGCYPLGNIYSATKHAVRAISQSLRMDVLGTRLRVSEVDPGMVETEFSEIRWNDKERAKQLYQGLTPLTAEDIADAVIYCATRPLHVNVSELVVLPQVQASLRDVYREEQPINSVFGLTK